MTEVIVQVGAEQRHGCAGRVREHRPAVVRDAVDLRTEGVEEHYFVCGVGEDETGILVVDRYATVGRRVGVAGEDEVAAGRDRQPTIAPDHVEVGAIVAQSPAI